MCGICGIVSNRQKPDLDLTLRMMGRLRHRGPDGSGYFRDDQAALGHTRLAIIDAEGGAQPLSNEDGRYWITFNGEIFNYIELAAELAALGHTMRTNSDTEVVVHAWEQWGPECFGRMNGQWAIALWDRQEKELVLSRDPSGILPLYYCQTRASFLFASEIKALFADTSLTRSFDPEGLKEIFTFWCPVAPRTSYTGIAQLEPGHWAVLRENTLSISAYWTPRFAADAAEDTQDITENGRRLRQCLIEASRLRFLRSDVPVAAYLSGGIDSSVTAAIIARYTDRPLKTFSLRFEDPEFDEGGYQHEMAQRLGTEHREIMVGAGDIAASFPDVMLYAETPVLRSGPAPLFLLSKLVRESGYRVVVTGEGSDEVLAGYDIFREARARAFIAADPSSKKRKRISERLYPWLARSPSLAPGFSSAFFGKNLEAGDPALSHRPRWDSAQSIIRLLDANLQARLTGYDPAAGLLSRLPPEAATWDCVSRAQWLEFSTLLPGYVLSSQGDRMLMANSVEGRFPFLDRSCIDLANSFPSRHKLLGLDEKHILKREFADLLPESIVRRPKQPYRAPDASSFFGQDRAAWLAELCSGQELRSAAVFDESITGAFLDKCLAAGGRGMSNTDNMRALAVISVQWLYRLFIKDGAAVADGTQPPPAVAIERQGSWERKQA